jgi:hypothetical protein
MPEQGQPEKESCSENRTKPAGLPGVRESGVERCSPKMGPFIRATPSCEFERPQWFCSDPVP